jgi:hypothetical protein
MSEREIFLALLDLSGDQARAVYLDQACAGDHRLRARVEALMRSYDQAGGFLALPASAWAESVLALTGPLDEAGNVEGPADAHAHADEDEALAVLGPSGRPGSLGRIGHYEVLEVLGRGGFGVVFRAFDEVLHRVVAVKVLSPRLAATSPPRKRFLREARSSAAVRHENVVQVYAVQEHPLPYLIMEFIPGETLQQRIARTGPLEVAEVLRIGRQVAEGLAVAHERGLIHRDIKPGNVLIEDGPEPRAKLTDFGLARAADDASLSQSGFLAGTPMYMSPEQAAGDSLDARSDLFSLGSLLYTMCCGHPPFRASGTLAVLRRVAEAHPRPPREIIPELPASLCAIIARLHARRPEDRYGSARDVAEALSRCLDGEGDGDGDRDQGGEVPPEVLPRRRRSFRWVAAAVVAVLAGLGLAEAGGVTDLHGTVIRLLSSEGTLVVEVDDPDVEVRIDGEELVITGAGVRELRLKPGRHRVEALKAGKLVRQELVTVARHGRQVLRVSQEAPVEPRGDDEAWSRSVAARPAVDQVEAVVAELRRRNPGFAATPRSTIENGVVLGLEFLDDSTVDLSPLRALPRLVTLECRGGRDAMGVLRDLAPLRGLALKGLNCCCTAVDDLAPLAGMPLVNLYVDNTRVTDLAPLRGMPLRALNCSYTPVSSLGPLKGMTLSALWCNHTAVTDLTPLTGMPLDWLTIHGTSVTDLTPLKGMPLTRIYLDFVPERDTEVLRSLTGLVTINDKPVAQFWKDAGMD